MDLIDSLPNELLLHIFDFLSDRCVQKRCIFVSKKWFNLIRNCAKLSSHVYLHVDCKVMKAGVMKTLDVLSRNWPKMTTLQIDGQSNFFTDYLRQSTIPNLKYISLKPNMWMVYQSDVMAIIAKEYGNFVDMVAIETNLFG